MGDMLSQAEIDALLGDGSEDAAEESTVDTGDSGTLTAEQQDVLGEIGNIGMGTSATTLYALLGQKVLITTPRVEILHWSDISRNFDRPCVGVRIDYLSGLEGANIMILKEEDVKVISNLMMSGNGVDGIDESISDIDLSAIAEAMNQMIGSAATSLSSLVKKRIEIATPTAFMLDFASNNALDNVLFAGEVVACVSFRIEVGTLIDSTFMQIIPLDFAAVMVEMMKDNLSNRDAVAFKEPVQSPVEPIPQPIQQQAAPEPVRQAAPQPVQQAPRAVAQNVNAVPVQFQNFDAGSVMQQKENIGIIMDVPLEVTAELGRTSKKIKDILEFTPGSILELDRLAGEPIDILVNGKFVAKGEVVVIEENFAVRVTEIVSAENRV